MGYPTVAWIAAFNRVYHNNEEEPTEYTKHSKVHHLYQCYNEQLIEPRDWFSYWRLNCRLATYHSYVTGLSTKENYDCEDKWKFLIKSKEKDIAVTPWLDVDIICKDRNKEGGLGFKAFKNAANTEHNNGTGGQWIIQEKLKNGKFLSSMLPKTNPPLSTFRIISSSKGGLHVGDCTRQDIKALSCVWRNIERYLEYTLVPCQPSEQKNNFEPAFLYPSSRYKWCNNRSKSDQH